MNQNQWLVFGIGLIFLSIYLFIMAHPPCNALVLGDASLISCYIRRYAYGIPAIISTFLGVLFLICSSLEPKKK